MMDESRAVLLPEKFIEWVGEIYKESAEGCQNTLVWFIRTLYKNGHSITKEGS